MASCFNSPTTTSFRGPSPLFSWLLSVQLAISEAPPFVKRPAVSGEAFSLDPVEVCLVGKFIDTTAGRRYLRKGRNAAPKDSPS